MTELLARDWRPDALGNSGPLSFGLMPPQGVVHDRDALTVWMGTTQLEADWSAAAWWPDGSVRSAILDCLPPATPCNGEFDFKIRVGEGPRRADPPHEAAVALDGERVRIGSLFALQVSLELVDEAPRIVAWEQLESVRHNQVCAVWRAVNAPDDPTRLELRVAHYRGDAIRADVTIRNPRRARHRGGLWDLGDPGSLHIVSCDLAITWEHRGAALTWRNCSGSEFGSVVGNRDDVALAWEAFQFGSGGLAKAGAVVVNGEVIDVRRITPAVRLEFETGALAVAAPDFWENYPSRLTANSNSVRVGVLPSIPQTIRPDATAFELQGGEQKTRTLQISTEETPSTPDVWGGPPPPQLSRECLKSFAPGVDLQLPLTEEFSRLLELADDAESGLLARREFADEYGWRDFGDVWADHEQLHYPGSDRIISHYNNQFDLCLGMLLQWSATGDEQWRGLFDSLARHVADIDIYRTQDDRPEYNGGLFWHSDHYVDAGTATHRAYSRVNAQPGAPYGGGPSNEHNYTTGLTLHALLLDNSQSRSAAISLANWARDMDDGEHSALGFLDSGPTGAASATKEPTFHGPGRGAGNSLNAVLDAYLLTGRADYLSFAGKLIQRVVHPADDPGAHGLLDAENRWSYTVFLVALLKYLCVKSESGANDWSYGFAWAALRTYIQWMAVHEQPYFDARSELEYPTETWPAQDMRKANVLRLGAELISEAAPREAALAKGDAIAKRAWDDLFSFEKPHTTRALAVLLVEGWRDGYCRAGAKLDLPTPVVTDGFGEPSVFIPQRQRIKKSLRSPLGAMQLLARLAFPGNWGRVWRAYELLK